MHFDHSKPVRRLSIGQPRPYAQHPVAVQISFTEPGRRTSSGCTVVPDSLGYYTIEDDNGRVFYDSRQDVPCDMEKFEATRQRFAKQWQDQGYTVVVPVRAP